MQVFKTDRKTYWTNKLKSWIVTVALTVLLFLCLRQFLGWTNENLFIAIFVLLLLKTGDTLTQYHVTEIQIDNAKKQLAFILTSIISGKKVKRYELGRASSELMRNSGLTRLFSSPFTLKILLASKDTYRINNRLGFSPKTLASVDNALKSFSSSTATK